jgi:tetratricopeptide (TPR) repeat protein
MIASGLAQAYIGLSMPSFSHSRLSPLSSQVQPDSEDVLLLSRRAEACIAKGDVQEALRCYQLALLMDEQRADLWFHYGVLQRQLGNLEDAMQSLEYALALDPTMYPARYNIARICCDTGRPLEGQAHFRQVVQQKPGYLRAWRHLVELTWALGDLEQAARYACDALQLTPGDPALEKMLDEIVNERNNPTSR